LIICEENLEAIPLPSGEEESRHRQGVRKGRDLAPRRGGNAGSSTWRKVSTQTEGRTEQDRAQQQQKEKGEKRELLEEKEEVASIDLWGAVVVNAGAGEGRGQSQRGTPGSAFRKKGRDDGPGEGKEK